MKKIIITIQAVLGFGLLTAAAPQPNVFAGAEQGTNTAASASAAGTPGHGETPAIGNPGDPKLPIDRYAPILFLTAVAIAAVACSGTKKAVRKI